MKEITITFSPEELRELAKQLYLAGYFLINCDYDNQDMVTDIENRICAVGFAEARETGGFDYGGLDAPPFTISREAAEECDPIVEIFEDHAIHDHVPDRLADRDFLEQFGINDPEIIFMNEELRGAYMALKKKYKEEIDTYGITHLRIQK